MKTLYRYMLAAVITVMAAVCGTGVPRAAAQTSVSPTVLEWTSGDTSTKYVTVSSGGLSWQTDSLVLSGHFQLSAISGGSGAQVGVAPLSQNATVNDITGEAYFYTSLSGAALSLIHRAAAYSISPAPSSLHWLRNETDAKTVTITANAPWTATVPSGCGFQLSVTQGSGNGSVNVSPQGISTSGRAATLTLTCGTAVANVSLVQDVSDEKLSIAGNWILERTYTEADDQTRINDITFYNGLGYPEQVVRVGASPVSGRNEVTPVVYDAMLRADTKAYLPYVSPTGSGIQEEPTATVLTQQASYWNGKFSGEGAYAFSRTERTSSLDRPESTLKPGSAWANGGHRVNYDYAANTGGEVRSYTLNATGTVLSRSGYRAAGTLYKDTVTDEDGCTVITYSDTFGRTVMQRRSPSTGTYADTYYVYDNRGNLAVVLSPEGNETTEDERDYTLPADSDINSSSLARYAYIYKSDALGRIQQKKLPGKAVERYVYDKAGRMVMSQDGRLRSAGEGGWWTVYAYDALGREVRRGLWRDAVHSGDAARAYWQATADAGGTLPQPSVILYECAYGSYANATGPLAFSPVTGVTAAPDSGRVRGLKTWERVAALGESLTSVTGYATRSFWYDTVGRCIQTAESRPGGTLLCTSTRYGFRGEVLATVETYGTDSLRTDNTYDARGRLLTSTATLDGTATMGAQYSYDDLGRLTRTTYGNGVTEDITYDIRGWRTGQTVKKGNTDIFSSILRYNTSPWFTNWPACYNGNISSMAWSHWGDASYGDNYLFTYDRMSRMTDCRHSDDNEWMDGHCERGIVYDRNTNIVSMTRTADEGDLTDNWDEAEYLSWTYEGNRRSEYSYDANGNLTSTDDGWTVSYNLLNLPASATRGVGTNDEQTVEWSYLADGTKIAAYTLMPLDVPVEEEAVEESPEPELVLRSGGQGEPAADSLMMRSGYLYAGAFRLRWDDASAPMLESVAAVGGRMVQNGNGIQQRYFITNHLGSTRVVLNNVGSVLERYDYYPYGGIVPVTVANTGNTDYLYTGKESQNELFGINWYDSGARFQTTDGIFTSIDPLAEKYYHLSPYAYCAGNPVNVIDPTGMDGIMTGSGTEEDPYVITANYYYQTGSLDSETVDGLNRALADYNNKGRSRKITMSDGSKVFVRFQLSAKEVDDPQEAYLNDWTLDANGGQIRYGNQVDTSANPSNSEENEFGSANQKTVSINLSNIDNGVKNGFNKSQLIEGTFLHEIGHNLGLDHTDNSTIMDKPTKHIQNQNGQTNMYVTYPVIDKTGIGLMIMRDNTNRIKGDVILGAINKK